MARTSKWLLCLTLTTVLSGCIFGSKKETTTHENHAAMKSKVTEIKDTASAEVAKTAANANCDAELTAGDKMQYNTKSLSLKQGCGKITLKNIGKAPKVAMGHNVLVVKEADYAATMTAAMSARKTDFIPASEKVLAYSKLLGPGEEDTLDLSKLPAGTYTYFCSFPGHASLMKGVLTIK